MALLGNQFSICVGAMTTVAACATLASSVKAENVTLSYGADVVTNYVAKGFTQTDNDPALQAYGELGFGKAYLSFFTSNASFGGPTDIEYDLGIGFRQKLGNVHLDFGYVQYLYRDDKTDYGEAYFKGSYTFTDQTHIGFRYYRQIFADYDTLYLEGAYSGLPWGLALSGGIGSDFGSRNLNQDAVYADLGISKALSDNASLDFRAHYSAIEGSRLIATISFSNQPKTENISFFSLFAGGRRGSGGT